MSEIINDIGQRFNVEGRVTQSAPYKSGHINSTFLITTSRGQGESKYILQKINSLVFRDVPGLMSNILKITRHIQAKVQSGVTHPGDRTLEIVETKDGALYLEEDGAFWRAYKFIDGSYSIDVCDSERRAFDAANSFGRFHRYLLDLSTSELIETIPHFMNVPRRVLAFHDAVKNNAAGRLSSVSKEIDLVLEREKFSSTIEDGLKDGTLPVRVVHGDLKLNNLLFEKGTDHAFCIVDLDTCMPGSLLFDFGDLVRNTSVSAEEDERDLSKVEMDARSFKMLVDGYLQSMGSHLVEAERELLPVAPRLIAYSLGVRFLTDYLNGDKYFRIERPEQNLDRARSQFKIVQSMERQESLMRSIVSEASD